MFIIIIALNFNEIIFGHLSQNIGYIGDFQPLSTHGTNIFQNVESPSYQF